MEMEVHQVIQDIIRSFCRCPNYHDDDISSTKTGCFIAWRFEVPGCSNLSINCHSFITHDIPMSGLILIMPREKNPLLGRRKQVTLDVPWWERPSVNGCCWWIFLDQLEVVDKLYLFVCFARACSLHTVISTENLLRMMKNDQEIKGTNMYNPTISPLHQSLEVSYCCFENFLIVLFLTE